MKALRAMLAGALLAFSVLRPAPAAAWWEYGHETVARIAWLEISPQTRSELRRLMSQSRLLETPTCAANTIESASYWPDCIKNLGERFTYASSWHYQNVDICRPFELPAACRDGNCISAQIDRQLRLLADRRVPARERLMALAFLVHFMGDLHQPMHAGDRGDLGGNRVAASYGIIAGRTNLHSVWDGLIADRAMSTPPGGAEGILSEVAPADRSAMREGDIAAWSREGWEVAREFAYGTLFADPCAERPRDAPRPVMTEEIARRLIPVVRRQAARGGLRLARLLDEALQPDSPWLRPRERRPS
ncbi:MAG: S1/P1 nuclease [Sphingomonas sp.]